MKYQIVTKCATKQNNQRSEEQQRQQLCCFGAVLFRRKARPGCSPDRWTRCGDPERLLGLALDFFANPIAVHRASFRRLGSFCIERHCFRGRQEGKDHLTLPSISSPPERSILVLSLLDCPLKKAQGLANHLRTIVAPVAPLSSSNSLSASSVKSNCSLVLAI
jgi:hypothetical protein